MSNSVDQKTEPLPYVPKHADPHPPTLGLMCGCLQCQARARIKERQLEKLFAGDATRSAS